MNAVFKMVFIGVFFATAVLLAYKLYLFLNNKIMESNTWFQLAGWSLLLFAGLGALLYATLYLIIVVYTHLTDVLL